MKRPALGVLLALLLFSCRLHAQATSADSIGSFGRPNGALMRAGPLQYTLSLQKSSGQVVPLGTRDVVVSEVALGGNATWLLAESRRGTVVETSDSVWVAHADLTPLRWTSTMGRAQLGASFTRDSVYGVVENYQGRASFAVPLPANALLSAGMVERIIEMLPLHAGYRAAASLMLVDGLASHAVAADLSVDHDVRIDVAGRSVDCWLVALRAGAIEERLWVSKAGSRVVRTEQAVADGLLVSVLTS